LSRLFYLISQGFENVWKNKVMFIASVFIITTTMITLGIFTIVGENAKALVEKMKSEQLMVAWLDVDIAEDKIKNVESELKKIDGIVDVTYRTKEQVVNDMREKYFDENTVSLTDGWEETGDFSDSYVISLKDLSKSDILKEEIEKVDGVDYVSFSDEVFSIITKISDIIKIVVIVIFILLLGVSFLVISNTIKLVLHSRRKEISIMKYIGATDGFVKTPFVIEAVIVGALGAIISWFATIQLYNVFRNVMIKQLLFEPVALDGEIFWMNIFVGILISCFACLASIKKYLKV